MSLLVICLKLISEFWVPEIVSTQNGFEADSHGLVAGFSFVMKREKVPSCISTYHQQGAVACIGCGSVVSTVTVLQKVMVGVATSWRRRPKESGREVLPIKQKLGSQCVRGRTRRRRVFGSSSSYLPLDMRRNTRKT